MTTSLTCLYSYSWHPLPCELQHVHNTMLLGVDMAQPLHKLTRNIRNAAKSTAKGRVSSGQIFYYESVVGKTNLLIME